MMDRANDPAWLRKALESLSAALIQDARALTLSASSKAHEYRRGRADASRAIAEDIRNILSGKTPLDAIAERNRQHG